MCWADRYMYPFDISADEAPTNLRDKRRIIAATQGTGGERAQPDLQLGYYLSENDHSGNLPVSVPVHGYLQPQDRRLASL